jgi:hypothetical protein
MVGKIKELGEFFVALKGLNPARRFKHLEEKARKRAMHEMDLLKEYDNAEAISKLIGSIGSTDWDAWHEAVGVLSIITMNFGRIGGRRTVDVLNEALGHRNPDIRYRVVSMLSSGRSIIGSYFHSQRTGCIPRLRELAEADPVEEVRLKAKHVADELTRTYGMQG